MYPIKATTISHGSPESMKALNRRLHWRKRGIVFQHDPRHVDVLVKELGLERGNSVQTPAAHDLTGSEAEPLYHAQHSKYRSQVARFLFLSQDRADITFIVNEIASEDVEPDQQSMAKLKRLDRCLEREREWRQVPLYEKMAIEMITFTDSDWAGCKETRKSSSA